MIRVYVLTLSLLVSLTLQAQPIPERIVMSEDSSKTVIVNHDKPVTFYYPDPGLGVVPDSNGKQITLIGFNEGTYRLVVFVNGTDRPEILAESLVIVGDVTPGPTPPKPPNPTPPDEPDVDEFTKKLRTAYNQCTEVDKLQLVNSLAELYSATSQKVMDGQFTDKTQYYIFTVLLESAKQLKLNGKVIPVQEVVMGYLSSKLGTDGASKVTSDYGQHFGYIASALRAAAVK